MASAVREDRPRRADRVRNAPGTIVPRRIAFPLSPNRDRDTPGGPSDLSFAEVGHLRRRTPTRKRTFAPCPGAPPSVVCAVESGVRKRCERRDSLRLPDLFNDRRPARDGPRHPKPRRGQAMSSRRFDTLGTARDLEATGIERGQAEAIAQAIGRDGEQLATREDIERLEARTASKEDVQRFEAATRDDFARLETATKDDFARLEPRPRPGMISHASNPGPRARKTSNESSNGSKRRLRRRPTGPNSTVPSGFRAEASSPSWLP